MSYQLSAPAQPTVFSCRQPITVGDCKCLFSSFLCVLCVSAMTLLRYFNVLRLRDGVVRRALTCSIQHRPRERLCGSPRPSAVSSSKRETGYLETALARNTHRRTQTEKTAERAVTPGALQRSLQRSLPVKVPVLFQRRRGLLDAPPADHRPLIHRALPAGLTRSR